VTPERWRQIEVLYHAALELSGEARALLLAKSDPEVRIEVENTSGSGRRKRRSV